MNLQSRDLSRLWPALGLGLLLAVAGGAAVWWGTEQSSQAQQVQNRSADQLRQIQNRLAKAREEASELHQSGLRFQELQDQGFFAPENRLEWVELLRQTRTLLAIPGMHYEFQPQRPLENGNGYFLVSTMTLNLSLNHEMELEPFLQNLSARSKALILARECDFTRASSPDQALRPGPNILVQCKLDWITGHLPGENKP